MDEAPQRVAFVKTFRVKPDALRIVNRAADEWRQDRLHFSSAEVWRKEEIRYRANTSVVQETEATDLLSLWYAEAWAVQKSGRKGKAKLTDLLTSIAKMGIFQGDGPRHLCRQAVRAEEPWFSV